MSLTKVELDELTDETLFDNTDQAVEASAVNALIKEVTNSAHLKSTGTDGRVFFQKSGELGQNANFFWNDTTERLGLGMGDSPSAVLDIKAQGTLSTDLALRIRNSANTADLFKMTGAGSLLIGNSNAAYIVSNGDFAFNGLYGYKSSFGRIEIDTKFSFNNFINNSVFLATSGSNNVRFQANSGFSTLGFVVNFGHSILQLGGNNTSFSGSNTFLVENGVAPTANVADVFQLYAKDIVAGNAAPHFRTENGSIIKLYQETPMVGSATTPGGIGTPITDDQTFDGYTVAQIVKHLRNTGLLA